MEVSYEQASLQSTIFNTTFTTHRVSPLFIGSQPLGTERLQILTKRLREALVGDIVRGVKIGMDSDQTVGKAGALEKVSWQWVQLWTLLKSPKRDREGSAELGGRPEEDSEDGDEMSGADADEDSVLATSRKKRKQQALAIELRYETTIFTALLLPDISSAPKSSSALSKNQQWTSHPSIPAYTSSDSKAFTHLPLLLLRMPAPLKFIITDFLCCTFDCRISNLHLGTRTLTQTLEDWLSDFRHNGPGKMTKELALALGFDIDTTKARNFQAKKDKESCAGGSVKVAEEVQQAGLKAIDVIIPGDEVLRFASIEPSLASNLSTQWHVHSKGSSVEEGWAWRNGGSTDQASGHASQPFIEAVARYLDHHMALNLFHPSVQVLRVACDGFVIAAGRVKIFPPTVSKVSDEAVLRLVSTLVDRAKGVGF